MSASNDFLCGIIEGFYGEPWREDQRSDLFSRLNSLGLNAYIYGPKDDDKHRNYWRTLYNEQEALSLRRLIDSAKQQQIKFIYALSPGLDIKFSRPEEIESLKRKLEQIHTLGCRHFAVFFDDIDEKMSPEDNAMFHGNFARAQVHVTNAVHDWLREHDSTAKMLFCPTEYCGMMANPSIEESRYLQTLGNELHSDVIVMWTGPDIISKEISVSHIKSVSSVLKRKPFIWDNYFANDYDIRRIYLGPMEGRSQALIPLLSGLMLNPNCEYAANFVPTISLAHWRDESKPYSATQTLQEAVSQWLPHFAPRAGNAEDLSSSASVPQITAEDVDLLINCFYLPYNHGPSAIRLKNLLASLLANPTFDLSDARVIEFLKETSKITSLFSKLTYIKNRTLLYSLYSYMWELKEECLLLNVLVQHVATHGSRVPLFERYHKAGTFRGGLVADLQRLYHFDTEAGSVSLLPTSANPSFLDNERYKIVPYAPEHEAGVYRVCLRTGDSGADGTHLFPEDSLILGHRYIGPYVQMEPELCFVLIDSTKAATDPDRVCGYTAAAFDTKQFYQRMLDEWYPKMRSLYPRLLTPEPPITYSRTPTQSLIWEFYNPSFYFPESLKHFHAHMHIDIVPELTGRGLGVPLIETLLAALRRRGARGLHLGMSSVNHRAYKFYRKMGFVELAHVNDDQIETSPSDPQEHTLYMGKTL